MPGVFHPGLFLSTKILLDYISELDLQDETFVEVGAGSGIISILAAKKGAKVTALEINKVAIENIRTNAKNNDVAIDILHSDLFQSLEPMHAFDYLIVNPPYYPKKAKNEEEQAWFCGENFEYFELFFSTLGQHFHPKSQCLMILSEDCDLERIQSIAAQFGFKFDVVLEKKVMAEMNYIFRIY